MTCAYLLKYIPCLCHLALKCIQMKSLQHCGMSALPHFCYSALKYEALNVMLFTNLPPAAQKSTIQKTSWLKQAGNEALEGLGVTTMEDSKLPVYEWIIYKAESLHFLSPSVYLELWFRSWSGDVIWKWHPRIIQTIHIHHVLLLIFCLLFLHLLPFTCYPGSPSPPSVPVRGSPDGGAASVGWPLKMF